MAEFIFVGVLGLLCVYLGLGVWGAVSDVRRGRGIRKEVVGFLAAVLVLLLLGVFAYSARFAAGG